MPPDSACLLYFVYQSPLNSRSVSGDRILLASTVSAKRVQFLWFNGPLAYAVTGGANGIFPGPYPKPAGNWYELKVLDNPFPEQIRALELIRDGLHGDAYILETAFNPWQVAVKLSSKEEVVRLQQENPQRLLDALDVLTQSHINHAKRAFAAGASGVLFSIANANRAELSPADYAKFSAPFDKRFFAATATARLNFLHLHWENEYVDQFVDFQAPVVNWSVQSSGVSVSTVRSKFSQTIATGIDEKNYKDLSSEQIRNQWQTARNVAGSKFILTPGCSVPNDSTDEELSRLPQVVGA